MMQRFVALAAAVLCLSSASVAMADPPAPTPAPSPTPINLPTLPPSSQINPYVKMGIDIITGIVGRQTSNAKNVANGRVSYFRRFEMQVQTGPNSYRIVHLHQGTTINPLGGNIRPGQAVAVSGDGQPDGSLDANVITIQQ